MVSFGDALRTEANYVREPDNRTGMADRHAVSGGVLYLFRRWRKKLSNLPRVSRRVYLCNVERPIL